MLGGKPLHFLCEFMHWLSQKPAIWCLRVNAFMASKFLCPNICSAQVKRLLFIINWRFSKLAGNRHVDWNLCIQFLSLFVYYGVSCILFAIHDTLILGSPYTNIHFSCIFCILSAVYALLHLPNHKVTNAADQLGMDFILPCIWFRQFNLKQTLTYTTLVDMKELII